MAKTQLLRPDSPEELLQIDYLLAIKLLVYGYQPLKGYYLNCLTSKRSKTSLPSAATTIKRTARGSLGCHTI
jgi:hypothetical protein